MDRPREMRETASKKWELRAKSCWGREIQAERRDRVKGEGALHVKQSFRNFTWHVRVPGNSRPARFMKGHCLVRDRVNHVDHLDFEQ